MKKDDEAIIGLAILGGVGLLLLSKNQNKISINDISIEEEKI